LRAGANERGSSATAETSGAARPAIGLRRRRGAQARFGLYFPKPACQCSGTTAGRSIARSKVRKLCMGAKLGGGGGGQFDLGQNSDINVTPFVDVMLVLLIIFMVAIPAATVSIKLDLPPAIPPPPGTKVKEPILINIQQGGGLFIGETATRLERLPADLSVVLSRDDPTLPPTQQRVYIRADRTVRYGDFMAVMNTLQGNGFYQVALINEDI
jgi:biopolymer transport protein ExbD